MSVPWRIGAYSVRNGCRAREARVDNDQLCTAVSLRLRSPI